MKRILLASAVGVGLFAIVAFAANLIVSGGGLQQGAGGVVCDNDGVSVTYQSTDANPLDFEQATVSDVDCAGTYVITVQVRDAATATLAIGSNTTSGSPALVTFTDTLTYGEIFSAADVVVTIVTTGP